MGTKSLSLNSLLALAPFLALLAGCSLHKSSPTYIPLNPPSSDKFEAADTNQDQVIDKSEAIAFEKKEKERKVYPFIVIATILGISVLACLSTPEAARVVKAKCVGVKEWLYSSLKRLCIFIKAKFKKKP